MSQEKLLQYVQRPQESPEKRPAKQRVKDFQEITSTYLTEKATEQSGRCAQCGIPYCQVHCPLGNNIPDWLYLTAQGRLAEAYQLSTSTNYFPEVCGRVCPQDRLCEGGCVIEQAGHGYVTIGSIEKYITEHAFQEGWVKPITPRINRKEKIAIIGAGPAGLSAGIFLRQQGYQVVVFDRYDRMGGLMIYGIPNFKLEKSVVLRRYQWLLDSGVEFHFNHDVGKDFGNIVKKYDAVVIATGVYQGRQLDIKLPDNVTGVIPALPYLTRENKINLGDDDAQPELSAKGKTVAVIGGGDTAMDCVRTAVRQGAKKVYCLYRRDRANMPGSIREVRHAEEEGVEFLWLTAPQNFVMEKGQLTAITTIQMVLSEQTEGRRGIVKVAGSEKNLNVDLAILALGFEPENLTTMFSYSPLKVGGSGTLMTDMVGRVIDPESKDPIGKIYAGGDIVRGASLVVYAVKDGMTVGRAIHHDLQKPKEKAA